MLIIQQTQPQLSMKALEEALTLHLRLGRKAKSRSNALSSALWAVRKKDLLSAISQLELD